MVQKIFSRMMIARIITKLSVALLLGLLSSGSSVENKICFNVSNQQICYFQPKEDLPWKQWETAWNTCQNNSATLPIIENEEVQKTFEEYLRNISLNINETWLGGRQVTKKKWQWSNDKPFYQPDLILYGDENQRTQAVIMRTSDSVSPSNATLRYRAAHPLWLCFHICQYSDSRCPADNSTIQTEHHGCLKVFNNRVLDANEATKDCNKTGGGHLAIFDDDEFLTKAPKVYQQMRYSSQHSLCYYIGLHRIDTKSWFWMRSNNEISTMEGNYDNWSDRNNNSNGDCLLATANDHRWEASNCFARKGFICQTKTLATTTTKEDADKMNDQPLVGLVLGIGIVVPLLVIIIILVIVILNLKKKLRKMSVRRSDNTVETQHYEELRRPATHANASDNYTELRLSPE